MKAMKLFIFFALVATLLVTSCTVSKSNHMNTDFAANPVVAHRGAFKKNGLPENSIASLKQAIALGCTGSEFDVWMTGDDSLVINHDPHFKELEIEKVNFSELRNFTLSNGEKLPSLREYLQAGLENNTKTRLVLEIKPSRISKERGRLVADRVLKLVKEMKAEAMIVYISFDYGILERIHEVQPAAILQYLNGDHTPDQLKTEGIQGADYHYAVFKKNPQWIEGAQKNRIQLNAWTVNDSTDMNWFLDNRFDFITTNEPELLFDILKDRKK